MPWWRESRDSFWIELQLWELVVRLDQVPCVRAILNYLGSCMAFGTRKPGVLTAPTASRVLATEVLCPLYNVK